MDGWTRRASRCPGRGSQPLSALAPTPEAHHAAHHLRRLLRRLRLRLGPPSPSRHGARRRGARKRRSPARTTTSSTLLAHDSHTHERRSIKPEWRWFQVSGGPSWSQNRARSPPWIQPPTLGTLGRWFPVTRSAPYTLKPGGDSTRSQLPRDHREDEIANAGSRDAPVGAHDES